MTVATIIRKGLFTHATLGEIEVIRLCGISLYKRVGVVHWVLGYQWVR